MAARRGHDVAEVRTLDIDPDDRAILAWAAAEGRAVVTMDKDFGFLAFAESASHAGVLRLPHVRSMMRMSLMRAVLQTYGAELAAGFVVTVQEGRVRVSIRRQT
jgi:predicted nuclease of predicted toxin-antitoxin system